MEDVFENLFTINEYSSEERYDLTKFFEFKNDVHDVLCSPFLMGLKKLPVWRYYRVDDGYKDIDMISYDAYGTLWYSYLIQIYNDTVDEVFEEGTVLNLFSASDLEELYAKVADKDLTSLG